MQLVLDQNSMDSESNSRASQLNSIEKLNATETGLELNHLNTLENINKNKSTTSQAEEHTGGAETSGNASEMITSVHTMDASGNPTELEKFITKVSIKEVDVTHDDLFDAEMESSHTAEPTWNDCIDASKEYKSQMSDNGSNPAAGSSGWSWKSGTAQRETGTAPSSTFEDCCEMKESYEGEEDTYSQLLQGIGDLNTHEEWNTFDKLARIDRRTAGMLGWVKKGHPIVWNHDPEIDGDDIVEEEEYEEWNEEEWREWEGSDYEPEPPEDGDYPKDFEALIDEHNKDSQKQECDKKAKKPKKEHREPPVIRFPRHITCHRQIPSQTTDSDFPDIIGWDMFKNDSTFESSQEYYLDTLKETQKNEEDDYTYKWMESLDFKHNAEPAEPNVSQTQTYTKAAAFLDGLNHLASRHLPAGLRELSGVLHNVQFCTEIYQELLARDIGFLTHSTKRDGPQRRVHDILTALHRWAENDMESALDDVRCIMEDADLCAELLLELNGKAVNREYHMIDADANPKETCDACGESFTDLAVRYGDEISTVMARGCKQCQDRRLKRAEEMLWDGCWDKTDWDSQHPWIEPDSLWSGFTSPSMTEYLPEGSWDGEKWVMKPGKVRQEEEVVIEPKDAEEKTGWTGDDWGDQAVAEKTGWTGDDWGSRAVLPGDDWVAQAITEKELAGRSLMAYRRDWLGEY